MTMRSIITLLMLLTTSFTTEMDIAKDVKNKKYLALGDSYTIGESVRPEDRFPVQLVKRLRKAGIPTDDPQIIATTGWTTDELLGGIEKTQPSNSYDLVTLLIGVNNQYRGRSIENYEDEFEQLLRKATELAGGHRERVIVISIPDYGVTPFGKRKGQEQISIEIDAFNNANSSISRRYGFPYVDITGLSRKAEKKPRFTAEDGLHPSAKMYRLWVRKIEPLAMKILIEENDQ
jgi:lysophospholipase L1-like esterase